MLSSPIRLENRSAVIDFSPANEEVTGWCEAHRYTGQVNCQVSRRMLHTSIARPFDLARIEYCGEKL
jgi:hypothetical protein